MKRPTLEFLPCLALAFVIVLFFGTIIKNGIEWQEHKTVVEKECLAADGVMYTPKSKGWPEPLCFNKDAIVKISQEEVQ